VSNLGVELPQLNEVAAMQSFIVLGIIPGINYQTTFDFWLYTALVLFCLPTAFWLAKKRHVLRAYFAARKINRFINQFQLQA
jgi:hypothetical protein